MKGELTVTVNKPKTADDLVDFVEGWFRDRPQEAPEGLVQDFRDWLYGSVFGFLVEEERANRHLRLAREGLELQRQAVESTIATNEHHVNATGRQVAASERLATAVEGLIAKWEEKDG